jgi:hypothetical protein
VRVAQHVEGQESRVLRIRHADFGSDLKVERSCFYVPGKWRSLIVVDRHKWLTIAAMPPLWLTTKQAEAVLVALDQWLERGSPVMTRLPLVLEGENEVPVFGF